MLPKFYQHIDCSTCAAKTLDHCYSIFRDAYKALPPENLITIPFCSSLPYRHKLKPEVPVLRTVQHWSDQSESMLDDCFDHADWEMFRVASENNIDEYTDTVTDIIRKCIGDVVPTVTIKT
jgi:hypothetical protein